MKLYYIINEADETNTVEEGWGGYVSFSFKATILLCSREMFFLCFCFIFNFLIFCKIAFVKAILPMATAKAYNIRSIEILTCLERHAN